MTRVVGVPIQGGVSIGPIRLISRVQRTLGQMSELAPSEEFARFENAKKKVVEDLERLRAKIAAHLGNDEAAIFLFQSMVLEDDEYLKTIYSYISDSSTAEYAIKQAGEKVSDFFASLEDSYMQARAADAKDISDRLDDSLSGNTVPQYTEPVIVASEELSPSVPALFVKNHLLGLVSHYGSVDSHAAILARAAKIPAVTGIAVEPGWDGHLAIIDGDNGVLTIDPDENTLGKAMDHAGGPRTLPTDRDPPALSRIHYLAHDKTPVNLLATIENSYEAGMAYIGGADGIGLYRNLAGREKRLLTEEDRFTEYRQTVAAMHGRPVVFQSLDVGQIAWGIPPGISRLRSKNDFFRYLKQQFRAILRAAATGPALVALSDINTARDIPRCRTLLNRCKSELAAEGLDYSPIDVGAIIRSPSSVLTIDSISAQTDFIALDGSALLHSLVNAASERQTPNFYVYVKMLQVAIDSAHSHTQRIMLFGNLQHYLQSVVPLFKLGIDDLSVPVRHLSDVQRVCRI